MIIMKVTILTWQYVHIQTVTIKMAFSIYFKIMILL